MEYFETYKRSFEDFPKRKQVKKKSSEVYQLIFNLGKPDQEILQQGPYVLMKWHMNCTYSYINSKNLTIKSI